MRLISVRIPDEIHRKIDAHSKKSGMAYSKFLRHLLEAGMSKIEDEKRDEKSEETLERILYSVLFTEQAIMRMLDPKAVPSFDEKKRKIVDEIIKQVGDIKNEISGKK